MKRNFTVLFCLILSSGFFSLTAFGQRATSFKLMENEDSATGSKLFITVKGQNRLVSQETYAAWLFNNGKEVAFTTKGKGWDGDALRLYDVATGQDRQLISKYELSIWRVREQRLSNGARTVLVELAADGDAGDGSLEFAVVDPKRGLVFYHNHVKLTAIRGDTIKLSYYKDGDWIAHQNRRLRKKAKPYKVQILDLKKVLKNKAMIDEE